MLSRNSITMESRKETVFCLARTVIVMFGYVSMKYVRMDTDRRKVKKTYKKLTSDVFIYIFDST